MPIQQNADIYNTFELDMIPDSAPVIVYCDQYDHGVDRLVIHLIDDGVPYVPAAGATAIIQGTKPDGHGFTYEATIDGSTVTADLTEQMTACYGRTRVQVVVTEGEDRTGTYVFYLQVQKSALPDDTEMSASDYALIQQLLQEAEELGTKTPYIGTNGDWYVYDSTEGAFIDTGIHAEGPEGPEGPAGPGVKTGGTVGQALVKRSSTNYDTEWATLPLVPSSTGTAGQILQKTGTGAWDYAWADDHDLPTGGSAGQALRKQTNANYDAAWFDVHEIPSGGTQGQALKKTSGTNYAAGWADTHEIPAGGTQGQVLKKSSGTDYAVEWANESGGGGTPAWSDVTNKPFSTVNSGSFNVANDDLRLAGNRVNGLDRYANDGSSTAYGYRGVTANYVTPTGGSGASNAIVEYVMKQTANASTYTFTNSTAITSDRLIDVYSSIYGENPTNVSQSGSTVTVTFAEAKSRTVAIVLK